MHVCGLKVNRTQNLRQERTLAPLCPPNPTAPGALPSAFYVISSSVSLHTSKQHAYTPVSRGFQFSSSNNFLLQKMKNELLYLSLLSSHYSYDKIVSVHIVTVM